MSKPSPKKLAKKRRRFKAAKKQRNVVRNMAPIRWRLDVLLDGTWCTARNFRRKEQLEAHVKETEKLRKGGTFITPGRVVDVRTGDVVLEVEGSQKAKGPKDAKADGKLKEAPDPKDAKKGGRVFKKGPKDRIPEGAAQ